MALCRSVAYSSYSWALCGRSSIYLETKSVCTVGSAVLGRQTCGTGVVEPGCKYLDTPGQYPATGTHSLQGPVAALSSATAVNTGATATIEKVLFEEVTVSTQPRQHSGAFEGQMPVSCCQLEAAEALAGLWQLSASLSHREKHTPCRNCLLDVMPNLCC